jgi:N-acetylmuramoyl-L-alanine amidase
VTVANLLAGAIVGAILVALASSAVACSSRRPASAETAASAPAIVPGPSIAVEVDVQPSPNAEIAPPALLGGRRICLDPGHDAYWVAGATGRDSFGRVPRHPSEGVPLHEHELTLGVAYRLKDLLEAEGASVCVTRLPRDQGGGLQIDPYDYTGDGRVRTAAYVEDGPERIQPRIDWANQFGAEVLVSVHFNGIGDPAVRGSEVYFTDGGPRPDDGRRLASRLLAALLAEMRAAGYQPLDRGIRGDAYQRYSPDETRRMFANNATIIKAHGADPANCPACYRLQTLGNNPMSLHQGQYVAALVEVEFLSNPAVVETFIMRPDSLDIIARGLLEGLRSYFAGD